MSLTTRLAALAGIAIGLITFGRLRRRMEEQAEDDPKEELEMAAEHAEAAAEHARAAATKAVENKREQVKP